MFREKITEHGGRVETLLKDFPETATIEASTKSRLIEPLLRCLGYDTSHPQQVSLEVLTELGGRIDYVLNGRSNFKIAVEAKKAGTTLSVKETNQLRSYFTFSEAVAGVLTNGVDVWLFTDLDKDNVMDAEPYLTVDIRNVTDNDIQHLHTLTSSQVNQTAIHQQAQRERYRTLINRIVAQELRSPSQELLRLIGKKAGISPLRKAHLKVLAPLVGEAISQILGTDPPPPPPPPPRPSVPSPPERASTDPWPSVYPGYDPGKPRAEPKLKGVTLLGRPLLAKNYTHMLCLVVAILQDRHAANFDEVVGKEPFFKETRKRQYISKAPEGFNPKYPEDQRQVGAYYVAVGLNAKDKVRRTRKFLEGFGYDPAQLVIHTSDE